MQNIIFIEHDPQIQNTLLQPLKEAGFTIDIAEDGEIGLQKIKNVKPNLVLLDADAPKKNGKEILEAIRTDFDLAFIPVIVITNVQDQKITEQYIDLGACDTLTKDSLTPEVVLNKVQKCFGLGGGFLNVDDSEGDAEGATPLVTMPRVGNAKILIIEDDQFLSELCETKLGKEGYEVLTALDGETGLQRAIAEKPELILLDLLLPGIDGFEVLKQMKGHSDEAVRNIPVLLFSNFGQEDKIQTGMALGAIDYLVKANFTTDEIVSKIKKVLEENRK